MVKFVTMRRFASLIALQVLGLAVVVSAGDRTADEARPRVEHHLVEADQIVRHFESVVAGDCPRFDSVADRRAYIDGEVDRVVLLVAHLEEAWPGRKPSGRPTRTSGGQRRPRGLKWARPRAWSRSSRPVWATAAQAWSRERSGDESSRKCRVGVPRLPFLDAEESELDERVLVACRRGGVEPVGRLLFPPDQRDAP